MTQKVHKGLHHGIPTYSLDDGGPCNGKLHVGVGMRDEPAVLAGITHLVEHLLLRMVQPQTVLHGGTTGTESVEFWASGEPEDVAAFLNAIAAAVCRFQDVSGEDIGREKAVIQAEDPNKFRAVSSGLYGYRFGAADLGNAHFGAPATESLGMSELLSWARQWFVAENAALTFTGEVPAALDVSMPPGSIPERSVAVPLITEPTLVVSRKDGVALSLLVPDADAELLAEALRYELCARLRHDYGLVYSVVDFQAPMDADTVQLDLILDPTSSNIPAAFDAGTAALHDIASTGFSVEALDYTRKARASDLEYGRSVPDWHLDRLAVRGLRGWSTPGLKTVTRHTDSTTAVSLAASLAASMESLMVAVAGYAKPRRKHAAAQGLAFESFLIWRDTAPAVPNGHRAWQAKDSEAVLWLTPDRLLKRSGKKTKAIELADIAVAGDRSCGCVCLLDRHGRSLDFDVTEWRKGKELRSSLLAAVPEDTVRVFPAD
ncbi:insulinase family protein [Arthrobacter cupressi]|uniref:Predicted Zn-dependent peptidase n=1 Tax=Arthrobacter cupressi TaxID=1045773 RepID=A0A1G8IV25_9MICC|nr:insulinase family protein [Arthrobacter cupressi]NYD79138.1 putative Zn-dependent peptidase [Arthrobacter cupressi]SDI22779.1 Predicted Zn-dependent peptidase [Arthrobacter cupressi]